MRTRKECHRQVMVGCALERETASSVRWGGGLSAVPRADRVAARTTPRAALLVLAKAPVPGQVKTRLCPPATPDQAARIAAAALLDTLDAVLAVPRVVPVVALTGDLAHAVETTEVTARLRATTVLAQRGATLGQRIAAAYADATALVGDLPVLQIGMDTPQGGIFDAALAGRPAQLVSDDGRILPVAVERWLAPADGEDDWLLDRCSGPTVDLGCGPGRLVAELAQRGVPALGVDCSPRAVRHCHSRGAAVLHRDLFAPLPGEGRWHHVLLADGNIGIGGKPGQLLHRGTAL